MANINRTQESGSEGFRQIEGDNWRSIYLPAICAGLVMSIVLFVAVACSKKDNPASSGISAPTPAVTNPAPSTAALVPEPPKKRIRKYRPTNVRYVNTTYGLSFSYPRKYSLQSGGKDTPVQAGFLKPGAVQIATVDMPDSSYPDTDFAGAVLNVSLHPAMSAEECGQFAGSTENAKSAAVKLGLNEFTTLEQMSGEMARQSDLKYFHLFKNAACYEFALDVETSRQSDEELAQVDRGQVFKQLEKIVKTARIKDVELPGVEKPVETVKTETPVDDSKTENAQVVTPEQK